MAVIVAAALRHHPRFYSSLVQRLVGVGNNEFGVDLQAETETRAFRTCTIGRIERERARLDLVEIEGMAIRAGHMLGERHLPFRIVLRQVDEFGDHHPMGQSQRSLDGIRKTLANAVTNHQTVDDNRDRMLLLLSQRDVVGQLPHLAVYDGPRVPIATQQFKQIGEFPFSPSHNWRQNLEAGSLGVCEQCIHHLLGGLGLHWFAAHRAVRYAGSGEQQTQVIVDLGNRSHRGTWVAVGRFLVDGDRRAQTLDEIDIRFVHLPEELAGIGGKRFDIPALALREQRVESHR